MNKAELVVDLLELRERLLVLIEASKKVVYCDPDLMDEDDIEDLEKEIGLAEQTLKERSPQWLLL